MKDYTDPDNLTSINQFIEKFEPVFMYSFAVEAAIKIGAQGLISGYKTYLSDAWNWLDFTVVITSILQEIIGGASMGSLRTFRLFRPLRTLTTLPSMKVLLGTLISSVAQLSGILGLATFFFLIFAILGISQWAGLTNYRCYMTEEPFEGDWMLVPDDDQLCGVRECEIGYCGSLPDRNDTFGDLYNITDLYRDTKIPSLNYGITNFDNIGSAFITIFQCITMEGWTNVLYIFVDVYSYEFVALYFILCVVVCSFFLLNMTIAVMLMEYEKLDKSEDSNSHTTTLKELGKEAKLPVKLVEFLVSSSNLTIGKKAKDVCDKAEEMTACQKLLATAPLPDPEIRPYYKHKIPQIMWKIAMSNLFGGFITIIIMMNTLILALDRYPNASEAEQQVLSTINVCFTMIFTIEVVVKILGIGCRTFVRDKFNIFDTAIVGLSLAEFGFSDEGGGSFGALRAVRLFRVFKLFKSGDLRILMDSIAFTISTIGNYTVLLCLFIYVYALMGMSFFAGKFRFEGEDASGPPDILDGTVPRANFDNLLWASLTVFQVMIGDNWTNVMYDAMRSSGGVAAVYFITLVMFGNIIMLNLLLAILLGNFDRARDFGNKKKLFETFITLKQHGYDLSQMIDFILDDMATHIKIKVLGWNADIVNDEENMKHSYIREIINENAMFMDDISPEYLNEPINQQIRDETPVKKERHNTSGEQTPKDSLEDKEPFKQTKGDHKKVRPVSAQRAKHRSQKDPDAFGLNASMRHGDKDDKEGHDSLTELSEDNSAKSSKPDEKEKARIWNVPKVAPRRRIGKYGPQKLPVEKLELEVKPELKADQGHKSFWMSVTNLFRKQVDGNVQEKKPIRYFSNTFGTIKETKLRTNEQWVNIIENSKLYQDKAKKTEGVPAGDQMPSSSNELKVLFGSQVTDDSARQPLTKMRSEPQKMSKSQRKTDRPAQLFPGLIDSQPQSPEKGNTSDSSDNILFQWGTPGQNGVFKEIQTMREKHSKLRKGLYQSTRERLNRQTIQKKKTLAGKSLTVEKEKKCCAGFTNHMKTSSMFIFPATNRFRKWCISLLEEVPLDNEPKKQNKGGAPKLGGADQVEDFNFMQQSSELGDADQTNIVDRSKTKSTFDTTKSLGEIYTSKQQKKKCTCRNHKIFENAVLTLIFTSSIMLIVDNPLNDPDSSMSDVIKIIDYIHTVLFTFEMLIKIIGLGFFHNSLNNKELQPYSFSAWNVLDFFVVMASLLDLYQAVSGGDAEGLSAFKALRALRALRPLRMISRDEGMKLVVNALLSSLPSMTNVLLVCSLLLLIFAIMGVNFFKGTFYYCRGLEPGILKLIQTKEQCFMFGGEWINTDQNFDNVAMAMLTLFQMMTTEGWMSVLYAGVDAVGVDQQPVQDYSLFYTLYFICFAIVGSQFIINLFVGVVIDNFNKIKEKEEMGQMFVTDHQRSWIEIQRVILSKNLKLKLQKPTGIRLKFYQLTEETKAFEYAITGCIVINTLFMAIKHDRMNPTLTSFLENANFFFAAVFNIEFVLKLVGMGKLYFKSTWNIFDMIIVLGTDLGIILDAAGLESSFGQATSVIRGFRIMRIFRLIRASVHIRLLIDTVMHILPQITNIMSLIFILFFIYSALAINLFSGVMFQDQYNEKANFRSFGQAMLLLMRCSTGEDWNMIMYELSNMKGYDGTVCRDQTYLEQINNGILGCGSGFSFFFFLSFMVIISMLIMNLTVAAVIEGLDTARKENLGVVDGEQIQEFIDMWTIYDPEAQGWITVEDLIFLMYSLSPPLGQHFEKDTDNLDEKNTAQERYMTDRDKTMVIKKSTALKLLIELNVKVYHKEGKSQVHYKDVLIKLMKKILRQQKVDYKISGKLSQKMKNQWEKKHKDLKTRDKIQMDITAEQMHAGTIILQWLQERQRYIRSGVVKEKAYASGSVNTNKLTLNRKQEAENQVKNDFLRQVWDRDVAVNHNMRITLFQNDDEVNITGPGYIWLSENGGKKIYKQANQEMKNIMRKQIARQQSFTNSLKTAGSPNASQGSINIFQNAANNLNEKTMDNFVFPLNKELTPTMKVEKDVDQTESSVSLSNRDNDSSIDMKPLILIEALTRKDNTAINVQDQQPGDKSQGEVTFKEPVEASPNLETDSRTHKPESSAFQPSYSFGHATNVQSQFAPSRQQRATDVLEEEE